MLNRILLSPDANSSSPTPHMNRTNNAKAVGGGLEAGSTDFGPNTADAQGGRAGANSDAGRSYTGNPEARQGGDAMAGAGGNDVTNTGRPLRSDAREAIGAPAVSGDPDAAQSQDTRQHQPGGRASTAAGTSIGTKGGGMMGTPAVGQRQRATDMTEGRVAGPPGALAGSSDTRDPDLDDAAKAQVKEDADDEWRRAGGTKK